MEPSLTTMTSNRSSGYSLSKHDASVPMMPSSSLKAGMMTLTIGRLPWSGSGR